MICEHSEQSSIDAGKTRTVKYKNLLSKSTQNGKASTDVMRANQSLILRLGRARARISRKGKG